MIAVICPEGKWSQRIQSPGCCTIAWSPGGIASRFLFLTVFWEFVETEIQDQGVG